MSPSCSRKSFLAKLGGLLAAASIVPALVAKIGGRPASPAAAPVVLRSDQRAVARTEGSY